MKQQNMVSIISFTTTGSSLAQSIRQIVEECPSGEEGSGKILVQLQESRTCSGSLKEWCRDAFLQSQTLIFVGAAGIAVRLIAESVKDKYRDPAVLVVDELGQFVIPILSGHVGGGNEFARFLAEKLGAVPVITTATDLYGKFAVDVFAVKNRLFLSERRLAKEISAAILEGEKIGFSCEKQVLGRMPEELIGLDEVSGTDLDGSIRYRIHVGVHKWEHHGRTIFLHPRALILGIGCKKGKSAEEIEAFVQENLWRNQLARESLLGAASVDIKKQEKGLFNFCSRWNLPFHTYSAQQLAEIPGTFTESVFVTETVGVGNVCERAAAACAMEFSSKKENNAREHWKGLVPKTAGSGITLAVSELEWSVEFE